MIFDTHAHYEDESFNEDRDILLNLLPEKDIFAVITAGVDIESSKKSVLLSNEHDYIYAAVGLHPEMVHLSDSDNKYINEIEDLILNSRKIVAIGEIGLDYHFNNKNKEIQKFVFESQIKLAMNHNLPIMVHDREAHGDTLQILKRYCSKGVVHCFSGSLEMAREIIKLGMYIGVGGVLTFKNARNIAEVIAKIPLSSIVLETDAPYLAPVPFRGKRCDSSYIVYIAQKISELKNIKVNEVLEITKHNACSLFKIKEEV